MYQTIALFVVLAVPTYNYYYEKLMDMPDVNQSNSTLPGNGSNYCGPASASNGLAWLADNGYPDLFDQPDQVELMRDLGEYCNTNPSNGTGPVSMLNGLEDYIADSGYSIKRLEYQGMRNVIGWSQFNERTPSKDWMMQGLEGNSMVLLGVGWYEKDGNDYVRNGGHWITLAGYEVPWGVIYASDPSGRSANAYGSPWHEWITLDRLPRTASVQVESKSFPGNQCYSLGGDLLVNKNRGDVGILDSVIVLELNDPPPVVVSPIWYFPWTWFAF